jgi:riboflavin kinase / FMN adenylyltransferase
MKNKLPVKLSGETKPFNGNAVDTDLKDGVYFGFASLADYKNQPALIFVGVPTTMGDRERRVEAHLLDIVDQDYYGQKLSVNICFFHRANQRFSSLDALKKAMRVDEEVGRNWFEKQK